MDQPLPFKVEKFHSGYAATFRLNGNSYVMEADEEVGGDWIRKRVEEYGDGSTDNMAPEWFDKDESFYTVTFRDMDNEDWDMTNRGEAVKVLSTVNEFVKQIIEAGVRRIHFSAAEDSASRARVYERKFKRANPRNMEIVNIMGEKDFYIDF